MNGGKISNNMKKALTGIILFVFPFYVSSQWSIDQSKYNEWLCRHVPGAGSACNAPKTVGNFPDAQSCDRVRRSALPNDFRWQENTHCIQCGSTSKPNETYYTPTQSQQSEEEELVKSIRNRAAKIEEERQKYMLSLTTEKENEQKETHNTAAELFNQMKVSSAPMTRPQLQTALEQAYCASYHAINAAKIEFLGKIDGDLETNAENMRNEASIGFDKEGSPCPPLSISVPDVSDPSFEKFSEALTQFNLIENESIALRQKIAQEDEILQKIVHQQEDLQKKVEKPIEEKEIQAQKQESGSSDIAKQLEELTKEAEKQKKTTEELEKEINGLQSRFDALVQSLKE